MGTETSSTIRPPDKRSRPLWQVPIFFIGVTALGLAQVEIQPWEDLDDPAGGDVEVVAACARDVLDLTTTLASILTSG